MNTIFREETDLSVLDKIQELLGVESAFFYLQKGSPFGGCCVPFPRDYKFPNPNFPILLKIYDKAYFVEFLRNKKNEAARI